MSQQNQQKCPEKREDLRGDPAAASAGPAQATLDGFTAGERERLIRLRRLVARGERSDHYPIDKRQDFVRWLIDQGKLSDN
jgi:hypothetical protein